MSRKTKLILPVLVLIAAAGATFALVRARPEVATAPPVRSSPLVRVVTVVPGVLRLDVVAQGSVLPRTETTLVGQVPGTVVTTSPRFAVGGMVRRGELLVALDPRDHELAKERAQAQIAQAELRLVQERAEAELAADEWRQLGEGEASPLVLRQPQVAQAEAMLAAARADLAKAELDLERSRIRAPFDGRIHAKHVELGQLVTPGTAVATLHAIDYAEVRLPVPDEELAFLDLPPETVGGGEAGGPDVALRGRFAGREQQWPARIVRSEGELDPRSRMLALVARVDDPYGRGGRPPLPVGLFVTATIAGREVADVVALPRAALRTDTPPALAGGDAVLVVDEESRVHFRAVDVLRREAERAIVASGLVAGDRVVVSPLDVVVEGMTVRTVEVDDAAIDEVPR